MQSTIACCGGFRYRPTTSVIFSRNFGSRESLKVSVRWGCKLWARQILLTVDFLTPWLCALALRHGSATPVRHPRRFGLQGRIHDRGDLVDLIGGLSSPAGSHAPQTIQPLLTKALAPQNHRVAVHRKPLRNSDIRLTRSGDQNDPAAQSHLLR